MQLANTTKLDRVKIDWAVGFSNSYDIEYSTDGENWSIILPQGSDQHTVVDGGGSRDDIHFAPVEAKYLRIRTVQAGDAGMPRVYSFAAYKAAEKVINEPSKDDPGNNGKWDDFDDNKYDDDVSWDDNNSDDTPDDSDDVEVVKKRNKRTVFNTKLTPFAIGLIVAGCVLVLGGGTFVIILIVKKKKKKDQEAEPPATE